MARRSKRPRVVWLPGDPFFALDSATLAGKSINHASDTLFAPNAGDSVTIVAPVIRDATPNALTPQNSLADIYSSGYRLRRIVGKFWCFLAANEDAGASPPVICVTAGFIILRTDPQDSTLPQNIPTVYATDDILNQDAPWIWRRTWILINRLGAPNSFGGLGGFQLGSTNAVVGGNSDGGHIDQKTARIVGPDERLFLVITATAVVAGTDGEAGADLEYVFETRVLGSLRQNIGNRRNASR